MQKEVKVLNGQSIFDIALYCYNDATLVYNLISENSIITDINMNLTGLNLVYTPIEIIKYEAKENPNKVNQLVTIRKEQSLFDLSLQYYGSVDNVYDLPYSEGVTYGDIFLQAEKDFSIYNFELADVKDLMEQFRMLKTEVNKLIEKNNVTVAYHMVVKSSHVFNLLDSRGALSVSQRAGYILEIREMVKKCCELYMLLQGK
jgi:hypothetical protein